jgi:hypothetical protein
MSITEQFPWLDGALTALGEQRIAARPDAPTFADVGRGAQGIWNDMNALQKASLATTPLPLVPDALGLAGDVQMYRDQPETRGWLNYLLSGLGAALPVMPAAGGIIKGLDPQKLAENYPTVGPAELKKDKKSGKEFYSKLLTDEEKTLQAARKEITEDIRQGNYSPLFPLEDRYYADPSSYLLEGNTLVDTLPKKAETIAKKKAQLDTPEGRSRLVDAYHSGLSDTSIDWYAMGQLQDAYIAELGPVEGAARFKEDFADSMAATTGGADPGSNMLMAMYGNFLKGRGMSPPDASFKMPHPIGGRYVTGNMAMYDKVINQGNPLTTAGQPKRFNFSANFLGDRSRATIDEQMSRGMAGINAPPQGGYGIMEGVLAEEADKLSIQPANMQEVSWAGFKGTEGKPMIQWVNELVERTSRLTDQDPEEVVRRMIRRETPIY